MKLKKLRQDAGLTQEDMAEELGISRSSYILKETSKRPFRPNEMIKTQKLLQEKLNNNYLSLEYIFFD